MREKKELYGILIGIFLVIRRKKKRTILRKGRMFIRNTEFHREPKVKNVDLLQAINAGEGVEKREPSYTVGGNAN